MDFVGSHNFSKQWLKANVNLEEVFIPVEEDLEDQSTRAVEKEDLQENCKTREKGDMVAKEILAKEEDTSMENVIIAEPSQI